jgi:hypothetical protein
VHWFDELTKGLGARGFSRKSALQGVAGGLVAGAASGPVLAAATTRSLIPITQKRGLPQYYAKSVPVRKPKVSVPPAKVLGPCRLSYGSNSRTLSYGSSATIDGYALRLVLDSTETILRSGSATTAPTHELTTTATLYNGAALLGKIVMTFAPSQMRKGVQPSGTMSVTYGAGVSQLHSAELQVAGGMVSGAVNGRHFVPVQANGSVTAEHVRFSDGLPAPQIDPKLRDALTQFAQRVRQDAQTCSPAHVAKAPGSWGERAAAKSGLLQFTRTGFFGGDGFLIASGPRNYPGVFNTQGCNDCADSCNTAYGICLGGCAIGGFFCPPCGLAAAAACTGGWDGCLGGCFIPYAGGCCKTPCAGFSCCDSNQSCCGGSDGDCCDSDEVCTGANICCPNTDPVGCGTICCPPGANCCGDGFCCTGGTVCVDPQYAICCPEAQACGSTCCSSGQTCYTASTGAKICCNGPLCGDQCCPPGAICTNGKCAYGAPCGSGSCGLTNPICCNGVCCASNETCVNGHCTVGGCKPGMVPCQYTPNQCCPPNFICCSGGSCCDPSSQVCCGGSLECKPKGFACIQ